MRKQEKMQFAEEEDFLDDGIVSATEMTGLIAAYPADEEEADNYRDILRYRSDGKKGRT